MTSRPHSRRCTKIVSCCGIGSNRNERDGGNFEQTHGPDTHRAEREHLPFSSSRGHGFGCAAYDYWWIVHDRGVLPGVWLGEDSCSVSAALANPGDRDLRGARCVRLFRHRLRFRRSSRTGADRQRVHFHGCLPAPASPAAGPDPFHGGAWFQGPVYRDPDRLDFRSRSEVL